MRASYSRSRAERPNGASINASPCPTPAGDRARTRLGPHQTPDGHRDLQANPTVRTDNRLALATPDADSHGTEVPYIGPCLKSRTGFPVGGTRLSVFTTRPT